MQDSLGVVVLAAGYGTRMKSSTHKVLHTLAGVPMIDLVLRAAQPLNPLQMVVVVGHGSEQVMERVGSDARCAIQDPPLGTGDAVRKARPFLPDDLSTVLVLYGDTPLVSANTLTRLVQRHRESNALVTILVGETHDPGRVVLDEDGRVLEIIEEKQATPEQLRLPVRNCGVCAFKANWLWERLDKLELASTGEYQLTDLAKQAIQTAPQNGAWPVASLQVEDPTEPMGINNRMQLAEAERILRQRILSELMLSGVTVRDPASTYVDMGVEIGRDTVILPGTHLTGATRIGENCVIGPQAVVRDSVIERDCQVTMSVVEESFVGSHTDVGPFSHLRPGSHIEPYVHIGNYVETKNSRLASGTACGHFSYLGDANIGENVNIGAGTITCNYDGVRKNPTTIGDRVFIGCDTMLIAPLVVGDDSRTGAGAVVTRDVPEGRTVVGIPARPVPRRFNKEDSEGK